MSRLRQVVIIRVLFTLIKSIGRERKMNISCSLGVDQRRGRFYEDAFGLCGSGGPGDDVCPRGVNHSDVQLPIKCKRSRLLQILFGNLPEDHDNFL